MTNAVAFSSKYKSGTLPIAYPRRTPKNERQKRGWRCKNSMLINSGVTAWQKSRCRYYRQLIFGMDHVVKSDMQETKKKRKLRWTFTEMPKIIDFRFSSRIKQYPIMGTACHIGRQRRPNLRAFKSFNELWRDVSALGTCHFCIPFWKFGVKVCTFCIP